MSGASERYARAIDSCSEMAKKEIERLVSSLDASHKKATRDALLVEVPRIVEKYGRAAATASAEYYEQERHRQIGGMYRAKLADGVSIEKIESTVRYACGRLFAKESDDGR